MCVESQHVLNVYFHEFIRTFKYTFELHDRYFLLCYEINAFCNHEKMQMWTPGTWKCLSFNCNMRNQKRHFILKTPLLCFLWWFCGPCFCPCFQSSRKTDPQGFPSLSAFLFSKEQCSLQVTAHLRFAQIEAGKVSAKQTEMSVYLAHSHTSDNCRKSPQSTDETTQLDMRCGNWTVIISRQFFEIFKIFLTFVGWRGSSPGIKRFTPECLGLYILTNAN